MNNIFTGSNLMLPTHEAPQEGKAPQRSAGARIKLCEGRPREPARAHSNLPVPTNSKQAIST